MPLLASVAVMLCVAMVLVVWSVMGGFLRTLLESGKSLIGDVSITRPVQGIPQYPTLIEMLEADGMVARATPVVEALGLLTLPSTDSKPITVMGVEPRGYSEVTGYAERLWWRPLEKPLARDKEKLDPRLHMPEMSQWLEEGLSLQKTDPQTGELGGAIVLGLDVTRYNNRRTRAGFVDPRYYFMPDERVTISVPPVSDKNTVIDMATRRFPVANEFRTGFYEADANWALMPIGDLQRMLRMDEAKRVVRSRGHGEVRKNADGTEEFIAPTVVETVPARATSVLVRAAEGVTAAALETRCKEIYTDFAARTPRVPSIDGVYIFTWENKPGLSTFIAAVKKETALVLVLFSFISLTSVFLVFAIFWSMISEKTKDIGVLRAIGASRGGVAWLFVRYGLAIGVVGSLAGTGLAYLIVLNINPIHEWLGEALGIWVWDPQVYLFATIPNRVEPWRAVGVAVSGVLSSALGALIPALRAAWMDPVRALRFE
jgi:lipoprotein-releasing system permease protein